MSKRSFLAYPSLRAFLACSFGAADATGGAGSEVFLGRQGTFSFALTGR